MMEPFLPSTHGHFRAGAASHDPLQPQRVPPLVRIRRLDPRRVLQITHAPCVAIKEDEEVALFRVFALPPRTPIHLLPFLQLVVAIEHGRLASGARDPGDGNTALAGSWGGCSFFFGIMQVKVSLRCGL